MAVILIFTTFEEDHTFRRPPLFKVIRETNLCPQFIVLFLQLFTFLPELCDLQLQCFNVGCVWPWSTQVLAKEANNWSRLNCFKAGRCGTTRLHFTHDQLHKIKLCNAPRRTLPEFRWQLKIRMTDLKRCKSLVFQIGPMAKAGVWWQSSGMMTVATKTWVMSNGNCNNRSFLLC